MSGWDFDFDQDESFAAGFNDADSLFFSGSPTFEPSIFQNVDQNIQQMPALNQTPIQQIPVNRQAPATGGHDLATENDQLRQFFTSLKEKAAQAESLNQSLKSQLEDCRNWFRDAMFTGMNTHKWFYRKNCMNKLYFICNNYRREYPYNKSTTSLHEIVRENS